MLIARAPVRISLAGGGTDLPAYFELYGGQVVSAAINRYFYVFVNVNEGADVQITSSDYRTFYRHRRDQALFWDGDLALPKAILHQFGIESGLSMFLASEVPPGTGLGSSSTVAVAISKALSTLQGRFLPPGELAELACQIELGKLGMPIGKQDQYAAAFGGLNRFGFSTSGVEVLPLRIPPDTIAALEQRLLLFFTGSARDSSTILAEQTEHTKAKDSRAVESLHAIKAMADEVVAILNHGRLDELGELLDRAWEQKKRLASGISSPWIDQLYSAARTAGAIGGKITGAGGGGFLMVYCPDGTQDQVTAALEGLGVARMDFRFDFSGARVLLNAGRLLPTSELASV